MSPGPAPTLLNDWVTPTGFGIIVAFLLIVAIGVVIAENLHDQWAKAARTIDAAPGPDDRLAADVARYHCQGHGCTLHVTSHDSRGTRYTCSSCGAQSWEPSASPLYDQDLAPGTDLNLWDREVGA